MHEAVMIHKIKHDEIPDHDNITDSFKRVRELNKEVEVLRLELADLQTQSPLKLPEFSTMP